MRPTAHGSLVERLARANRDAEHTLLHLHIRDLELGQQAALRAALEQLTARLWGPTTLDRLSATEYALLLEHWSLGRGRQLAELLAISLRRALACQGRDVTVDITAQRVRPRTQPQALVGQAARAPQRTDLRTMP